MRPTSALSKTAMAYGTTEDGIFSAKMHWSQLHRFVTRASSAPGLMAERRPGRSSRSSSPTSTASTSPGPTPLGRQSRIGEPCNSESGGIWESLGTLRLSRTLISSRSDGARRCSSKTNAAGEHFSIITTTSRGSRLCTRQSSKTWSIRSRKFWITRNSPRAYRSSSGPAPAPSRRTNRGVAHRLSSPSRQSGRVARKVAVVWIRHRSRRRLREHLLGCTPGSESNSAPAYGS